MDRNGRTDLILLVALCASLLFMNIPIGLAQAPPFLWSRTYGGTKDDEAHCVIRTNDCGYVLAGWTNSFGLAGIRGWLVKTDSSGRMLWNKTYGGSSEGKILCVVQTTDDGYALSGWTLRVVQGFTRNVAWLIKTDANGNMLWERTYENLLGIIGDPLAYCLVERIGGGFVLAGSWVDRSINAYQPEFWLVTDVLGNMINSYVFPTGYSQVNCIIHTIGGGYFLAGVKSGSFGLWKIDQNGNLASGWPKTYGRGWLTGSEALSLVQTDEGGCLLVGHTWNVWPPWDMPHYIWVIKTDNLGSKQWDKIYMGSKSIAFDVVKTSDGYVLAGYTNVNGYGWDVLLLKIDFFGNQKWTQSFIGVNDDLAYTLTQSGTGGFVLAGFTDSFGAGGRDFLLINFGPPLTVDIIPYSVSMYVDQSVTFSSAVSGGTPPYSYQWYLNDTLVSGATLDYWIFTPTLAGYYTVHLKVTDDYDTVRWSNTVPVSVSETLSVSIYPTAVVMDVGQSQMFSSTVYGGTLPYTYKWFVNGAQAPGATSSIWAFTPSLVGNYVVLLQVTDSVGLTRNSNEALVTVNPEPIVTITPASATTVVGISELFFSTVSGGTPPFLYEWFVNDGLVPGATYQNLAFIPAEIGVYKVYLNVTDCVGVTSKSNEAWLTAIAHPVANFTWSPSTPKVGEIVTFDGSASTSDGGTIIQYEWDFGDGGRATGKIVTHAYFSKGAYTVALNVTDSERLWDIEQKQIQVVQTYTLAVYSLPTGITFTVDGVPHTTPWSSVYDEGAMPNLVMPDTYTVSGARYLWNKWDDGVTTRSRTVTMDTDISLTAKFTGPNYQLTVTSTPITGIPFTINSAPKTTPYVDWLAEGYYALEMPQTYNGYNWSKWLEDGDTNRVKTIYLHGTTWTGVYVQVSPPTPPVGGEWVPINKFELLAPWIGYASVIAVAAASLVYVNRRKKQQN